ncbi:hypothetical protein AAEO50_18620 [Rossellomorea oryzaecorticis]|uniref:DUF3137 domain-containing protein n=1 Tax=Rossellomorea oryzaecorticis TaxID=1396505 RepID=A0ABU9KDV6_9BACI
MNKEPLRNYLRKRSSYWEILIVGIVLGASISLTVSSLTLIENFPAITGIVTGIILCVITSLTLMYKTKFNLEKEKSISGFLHYDDNKNIIKSVPRYDFSTMISEYLESAFIENPALLRQWKEEPLKDTTTFSNNTYKYNKNFSHRFICQAVEYYLLSKTSTYLTDYFNSYKDKNDEDLKVYRRDEVPEILLNNKLFELFSRPIDDRTLFDGSFHGENTKRIALAYSNGARFENFNLTLPKKSKIKRVSEESIEIETPRFKLLINVNFRNTNTVFPMSFNEFYLGDEYSAPLSVKIDIKIKFKFSSFFFVKDWKYYEWVDELLYKLDNEISKENFFRTINWDTALTLITSIKNNEKEVARPTK